MLNFKNCTKQKKIQVINDEFRYTIRSTLLMWQSVELLTWRYEETCQGLLEHTQLMSTGNAEWFNSTHIVQLSLGSKGPRFMASYDISYIFIKKSLVPSFQRMVLKQIFATQKMTLFTLASQLWAIHWNVLHLLFFFFLCVKFFWDFPSISQTRGMTHNS